MAPKSIRTCVRDETWQATQCVLSKKCGGMREPRIRGKGGLKERGKGKRRTFEQDRDCRRGRPRTGPGDGAGFGTRRSECRDNGRAHSPRNREGGQCRRGKPGGPGRSASL